MESLSLNISVHLSNTRFSNCNFISPRYNRVTEGGRSFVILLLNTGIVYQLNLNRKLLLTFLSVPCGTSFLMSKNFYLILTLSFMTLLILINIYLSIIIVYLVLYVNYVVSL